MKILFKRTFLVRTGLTGDLVGILVIKKKRHVRC